MLGLYFYIILRYIFIYNVLFCYTEDERDEASDATSERSHSNQDQMFNLSLNLTPGQSLQSPQPGASSQTSSTTSSTARLNDHAKSMMSHFKMALNSGGDASSLSKSEGRKMMSDKQTDKSTDKQPELWRKYLTRFENVKIGILSVFTAWLCSDWWF